MDATSRSNTGPLLVLDRYAGPQAGTERQVFELARGLSERNRRPGFLLLHRSAWLEREFPESPFFVVGTSRLGSVALWRRAQAGAAWAAAQGFQLAHIFLNDCAVVFPGLLHARGLRVVQARRDLGFWYTPLKLRMLRLNRRWTAAVVANSRAVAHAVGRAEGYDPDAFRIIHNGLRALPESSAAAGEELRRSMGLGPNDRLVVMVANLRPLKRPQDAVRAVAALNRPPRSGVVHLALVGDDPDRDGGQSKTLQELAGSLGIAARVHLPGLVASAAPWVRAADACLLCSETEGLSNAVIEYMLAGKPVVCSDAGGNPELVSDGQTGWIVPVGDVPAVTDRLARVLDNPEESARLGASARARAMAEFTVEAMLTRHQELYASLEAARAGPVQ